MLEGAGGKSAVADATSSFWKLFGAAKSFVKNDSKNRRAQIDHIALFRKFLLKIDLAEA